MSAELPIWWFGLIRLIVRLCTARARFSFGGARAWLRGRGAAGAVTDLFQSAAGVGHDMACSRLLLVATVEGGLCRSFSARACTIYASVLHTRHTIRQKTRAFGCVGENRFISFFVSLFVSYDNSSGHAAGTNPVGHGACAKQQCAPFYLFLFFSVIVACVVLSLPAVRDCRRCRRRVVVGVVIVIFLSIWSMRPAEGMHAFVTPNHSVPN